MIKFFRHIRQALLNQNRFGKYLLYALGEIILVVIGILIAVGINTANENRKEQIAEEGYIQNIIRDLNSQLKSIYFQKIQELEFFHSSQMILDSYHNADELIMDSSFFHNATILTVRRTFVIDDPTYTDLISSGNIELIKTPGIKDAIIQYYQELERLGTVIQNNNTFLVDRGYVPVYRKIGYFPISPFEKSVSFEALLESTNYNPKLLELSSRMQKLARENLSNEDEQVFINALTQRHFVAVGHLAFMTDSEKNTNALIELLTEYSHD